MKLLLLTPPHPLGSNRHQKQPPLSLLVVSARLAGRHEVMIEDLHSHGNFETVKCRISESKPDLIGITTMTYGYPSVINLTERLKGLAPDIPIILGGVHPTLLPFETLKTSKADFVLMGDGEDALLEFLNNGLDTKGLPNIVTSRSNPAFARAGVASNVNLPVPYNLIDESAYGETFFPLLTARGCPQHCTFCSGAGKTYRPRDFEVILKELNYLIRNGISRIFITDDTFNASLKRAKELCRSIYREFKDSFRFMVNLRANRIDDELASLLKMTGCKRAYIGVESGSRKIIETIRKAEKEDDFVKGVRTLKSCGIETNCSFIVGLPGETLGTVDETVGLAKRIDPDIAMFNIFVPYPGTGIYENESALDIKIHDKKWYLSDNPNTPHISTAALTGTELQHLVRECYRRYYLR